MSEAWGYRPRNNRPDPDWDLDDQTLSVRAGLTRTGYGETGEALFLTSGFTYSDSAEASSAFAEKTDHYLYSRFHNPTVAMFEKRLAALEGAEACLGFASGMAAMFASLACCLASGDRVVAAEAMFSSCHVVLTEILPKWGVKVDLVKGSDKKAWEQALSKPTKVVFVETPSNPLLEIVDLAFVSSLAKSAGAILIVDNVIASPVLQKPITLGADVVMYSTTKHIDGQGRVLGGAILGSANYFTDHLSQFYRHTGPSMSPFTAWVLVKSLETMKMRVTQMSTTALEIAQFLESHPKVASVNYPGLTSHPDHDLAMKQMNDSGGSLLSFTMKSGREGCDALMDRLRLIDISNNLGDSKSLMCHPASSTHKRLGEELLAKLGIGNNLLRLSIGLESPRDLIRDLSQALELKH